MPPIRGRLAARVSERTEEPGYVGGQQLGRLGCREVAAPRHGRPALDVVEALEPAPRNVAFVGQLVAELGEPSWDGHEVVMV
jgi:hypothetical protein